MLISSDQMPQSGATGAWIKVEYHTNLTIPFLLYFDTGKPLYFNCFKNAVNHTLLTRQIWSILAEKKSFITMLWLAYIDLQFKRSKLIGWERLISLKPFRNIHWAYILTNDSQWNRRKTDICILLANIITSYLACLYA